MLPVSVCLVALFVLLLAERAGRHRAKAVAKLTASSAFVWAALAWGAADTFYGQLLLLGLLLCWIGDALLLPSGKALWFQLGILAFMLAHLAYALAFSRLALDPIIMVACGLVVGFGAWSVLRWLRPHLRAHYRWLVAIDVEITPEIPDQELDLSIRYWEGASRVAGTSAALAVTGHAHVELTGYAPGGVAAPR